MKYTLINRQTGEEHLCYKVTIDEFDYYVNDYISDEVDGNLTKILFEKLILIAVATNNPNIDIPKVVDEVGELALKETLSQIDLLYNTEQRKKDNKKTIVVLYFEGLGLYKTGYNKSQETHPFSEEDMIEFAEWKDYNFYQHINDMLYRTMRARPMYKILENKPYTTKELLQLWKEQRSKIVYYESN